MNVARSILLFCSIIEPFIWLNAFDRVAKRKFEKKFLYLSYIIGDWILALIRSYVTTKHQDMNVVFTISLVVYVLVFVWFMYENTISKKLFAVGLLFLFSLSADFISIGILMLFGQTIKRIAIDGICNSIATLLSKCVFWGVSSLIMRKHNVRFEWEELVPIVFGTILYELPSVVLYNKISLLGDNEILLILFVFGELAVLFMIGYIIIIINRKKRMELQLRTRIHDIEIEIAANSSFEEVITELSHFRHDIKSHFRVLNALLNEEKYDEAKQYLYEIEADGIGVIESFTGLKNKNVSVVLSQRKRYADEMNVNFFREIMVEDFIIPDKDICTILCNVLDNAIEAASKCNNRYVNIVIRPDAETTGYFIECLNSYQTIDFRKGKYITTKGDRENHGLGISIIRKTVSKNKGKCFFKNDRNSNMFTVEIYIPGRDVNDQCIDM